MLTAEATEGVVRGDRGKVTLESPVIARDSQLPLSKDTKPFAHPRYWAAFILIGDPN